MLSQIKPGDTIHLMGVCGTAMASLAGLLQEVGYHVTGSDQNVYPPMSKMLEDLGISVMQGYKAENLDHKPNFVIVGNVISKPNAEAQALLKSGIPYTSLPKAMGELVIGNRNSLVVSGTHGKTTTTSILAYLADCQNLDPGFFVGGIPLNYNVSFKKPLGDHFIIEGDEYDTAFFDKVPKFIYYKPKYVILTGIEFDHADIYNNIDEILLAFTELLKLIPEDGFLVYNGECKNVGKILNHARCRKVSFGAKDCDYIFSHRTQLAGRNQITVEKQGKKVADLALKLFGYHNTLNALSCYALATELGWNSTKTLQGLADFKGIKRRQEIIGQIQSVTVVEDFAHHPTAVNLTVKAMKEQFPNRRLLSVFEPRSATSRRNTFQKEYAKAFESTDLALIAKPYNTASIPENERFSSEKLISDIHQQGGLAHHFSSADEILSFLMNEVRTDDVILIMSNGGFDGLYKKLLKGLEAKSFSPMTSERVL